MDFDYHDRSLIHGNVETLVLAILADRACHGYELRKELSTRSNEEFQLALGRLYPLLRALERRGLVTVRKAQSPLNRECREYAITAKGASALRERKLKWRQFAAAMNQVLART